MDNNTMLLDQSTLNKTIQNKRQEMIKSGLELGLSHIETIKISKELDKLINIYNKRMKMGQGDRALVPDPVLEVNSSF
ncbi:aspartyl-phosphate phosphatase Spo0E family protein [Aquibacillus sediminis]|uniref:aspartyl-phosphate phosphatase Spo0E family protein n=1 Tax=Aquibacillus sediminis TaxID=2574734 RepID=UPI00110804DC|nr:aspartyl-phosphate phosphatase Spo0E family protein [Aquibacillus sediminis]